MIHLVKSYLIRKVYIKGRVWKIFRSFLPPSYPVRALRNFPAPPCSLIGNSERYWQWRTQFLARLCFTSCEDWQMSAKFGTSSQLHDECLFISDWCFYQNENRMCRTFGTCVYNWLFVDKELMANCNGHSQDGGRVNLQKISASVPLLKSFIDDNTFSQTHLDGQYL